MSEKIADPKNVAGGLGAINSSIKHAFKEMGFTRSLQTLSRINQKEGFDCPGCAWPDPDHHRTMFEFCENGVKAIAEEATLSKIGAKFFKQNSISSLKQKEEYWLSQQGRLSEPLVKLENSDFYEPIEWEKAFKMIARDLHGLENPDQALFYTSGRTSNEAAFLYQLFVRAFGTNNLPDCSNMCHESSGVGLGEVIGIGKGSVTLEDFDHADCILVIGQNPGTNHPRMLSTLQKAKKNGAKIIQINPLPEAGNLAFKHPQSPGETFFGPGTPLCDQFLQVKINGDVALLKGIAKLICQKEDYLDHKFIADFCHGFAEFKEDLNSLNMEELCQISGISHEQMQEAANLIGNSKNGVIGCWAMGLTQHENGVANIQSVVNLLLLGGNIGRKGAGVCPVRGHSNVQGDRTMGIWERPSETFLDRLQKHFKFDPPRKHGFEVVSAIEAMLHKKATVFFAMGGNFISAAPDTEITKKALENCKLTVQVSTKLNASHLYGGKTSLILPCLARSDEDHGFVTVENSMGIVHSSKGFLKPFSNNLLSETTIIAKLAIETFKLKDPSKLEIIDWQKAAENYDYIRDHISQVIPGFENYNEKVKTPGGFYLPHPVRDSRTFNTKTKKAEFRVHPAKKHLLEKDQFLLMTLRSHDQYNTTIYGMDDRYRGVYKTRKVIFINRDDLKEMGLEKGQYVNLKSHFKDQVLRRVESFRLVPYSIPRGCLAAYFPETNPLVPLGSKALKSHTPASKSIIVSIEQKQ